MNSVRLLTAYRAVTADPQRAVDLGIPALFGDLMRAIGQFLDDRRSAFGMGSSKGNAGVERDCGVRGLLAGAVFNRKP